MSDQLDIPLGFHDDKDLKDSGTPVDEKSYKDVPDFVIDIKQEMDEDSQVTETEDDQKCVLG